MRIRYFLAVLLCTLVLGSDFSDEIGTVTLDASTFILGSSYTFSYQKLLHKRLSLLIGYGSSNLDFSLKAGDDNFFGFAFEPVEEDYDIDFQLGRFNLLFLYHITRDKEWLFFDTIGLGFGQFLLRNRMKMTTADGLVMENEQNQRINGTCFLMNFLQYSPRPVPDLHISTGLRFAYFNMAVPTEATFTAGDSTRIMNMKDEMGLDFPENFGVPLPEFYIGISYTGKLHK